MDDRKLALKIAFKMWGTFYSWGGDDPSAFDCSGMYVEILKSTGQLPRKRDWTAQGIYNTFSSNVVLLPHAGDLVFFGSSTNSIIHVEMMFDDLRTIGASGGGSRVRTEADAIRYNAFIKIRPLASRSDLVVIIDPFMEVPE